MWSTGSLQVLCDYLGDDFYLLLQLSNKALLPEVFPLINEEYYFKYQLNQQLETVCRSTKMINRQQLLSMIQADNGQMTGSFLLKAILPSMISNDIDIFLPVTSTHDKTLTEKYLLECGAEITRDIRTTDDYLHHRGDAIIDVVDYTFYINKPINKEVLPTPSLFEIPGLPDRLISSNLPTIPGMSICNMPTIQSNYNVTKMVFQVIRIDKTRYSVEQYIDRWFDFEIIKNTYNGKSFKIKTPHKIYTKCIDLYEMKWVNYNKMISRLYKYHLKSFTVNICTPYFLQFINGDTLQMTTKDCSNNNIQPEIMVPSNHHSMKIYNDKLIAAGCRKDNDQVTYVSYRPLSSEAKRPTFASQARNRNNQQYITLPLYFNLPKLVMVINNNLMYGDELTTTLLNIPDIHNILNTYYNYITKALREYDELIGYGHIF